ncbi:hypothetical protein AHS81_24090 [Salmonella enterica]|nr:hypothetical protein [Salmonella enterica]
MRATNCFTDNGQQINPLTARLTGNVAGVMKLFNRCNWLAESERNASLPHQYTLTVKRMTSGDDD